MVFLAFKGRTGRFWDPRVEKGLKQSRIERKSKRNWKKQKNEERLFLTFLLDFFNPLSTHTPSIEGGGGSPPSLRGWTVQNPLFYNLGGHFGPDKKKKKISPPPVPPKSPNSPQTPSRPLGPSRPGDPPPFLGFSIKNRSPPPSRRLGPLLPPRAEKNKNYPKCPPSNAF